MSRPMSIAEKDAFDNYMSLAKHCREKARDAIHKDSPVAAHEWLEAANQATQAAAAIRTDVPDQKRLAD